MSKKVIVITGATGLLGKKHAEAIACYGGTAILLDLSHKEVNDFASELTKKYKVRAIGLHEFLAIVSRVSILISVMIF